MTCVCGHLGLRLSASPTIIPFILGYHEGSVDLTVQISRKKQVVAHHEFFIAYETALTNNNDLLNVIYSQQATHSKDMAFDTWAILERQSNNRIEALDYSDDILATSIAYHTAHMGLSNMDG
jgi:hypothetical protein